MSSEFPHPHRPFSARETTATSSSKVALRSSLDVKKGNPLRPETFSLQQQLNPSAPHSKLPSTLIILSSFPYAFCRSEDLSFWMNSTGSCIRRWDVRQVEGRAAVLPYEHNTDVHDIDVYREDMKFERLEQQKAKARKKASEAAAGNAPLMKQLFCPGGTEDAVEDEMVKKEGGRKLRYDERKRSVLNRLVQIPLPATLFTTEGWRGGPQVLYRRVGGYGIGTSWSQFEATVE
ncbi:hypothetical protein CPB84DRAFT_1751427 [Gymnopilus junonius]|uniref:Uncharacterized protein n=1 Tax=Gymnopilus junonius TaxID=109634 RepID=A0A9P5NFE9_GYMJU|nr:hypothetical protein CPB84DRAFT_1751427 [Gymnopilus junonius]